MMDREKGAQQKLLCVTMESLMPERHFLRDLDRLVDFSFVYDKVESLYSHTGRRSVDPVVIVKMMLLGYLYGIDSERRLEQEVQVNIAFRWFLRIDLDEPVPDHSTFSQLRRRKFNETTLFEDIFTEVVRLCIKHGLITGKLLLTDSTHVRANARNDLYETVTVTEEPTDYIKRLNEKAVQDGLLSEDYAERMTPETREIKRSTTDPESGCMNRPGKPTGFHYLDHQTCDSEHGLITDVFVTPGNASDCSVHSERIQHQIDKFQFETEAVSADRAYDCAEIHADMLARGIKTYIAKRKSNSGKNGLFSVDDFSYNEESDTVICPQGEHLHFSYYSPKDGVRHYRGKTEICQNCPLKKNCISNKSKHRMVHLPSLKEASEKQHESDGTETYKEALRLRQIWCEGNFSHQKANHNLKRIRMRGLGKATVHCLLSATAFNLKRMVRLLIQPLLFLAYLPYSLVDMLCRCLCWQFVNSTKRGTFSEVLGVSTSAEVDEGRRPFKPCQLLKKLDQNFYTCNSPFRVVIFISPKSFRTHVMQFFAIDVQSL